MASTPPKRTYRSLRITSLSGWDNVLEVLSTLNELEQGQFWKAAILADQFGRDDRIDGVLRTRVDELLSTQLDILPADDRRKSVRAAEMLGGVEDGPGEWDRMCPNGVASKMLRTGLCLNLSVAQIMWTYENGIHWPRLRYWNSQFIRWDEARQCFLLRQYLGPEIELPRLDENPIGDGQWFVWCPFGYQEAWLGGLVRPLAPMYMRRMWLNRDWARSSELYGQGIVKAIVPAAQATTDAGEDFLESVANRGSDATIKIPQGEEGNKYDVELEVAAQKIYETFRDGKSDVNTDIAVTVLGQNLTTQSPGGGLSNGGDQKGPRAVMLNKARQDAAFAAAFRDQVLVPWARFNFGDPDLAPVPIYRVDPPDNEVQKAAVLKGVGDAIASLDSARVPVDIRGTAEEFGIKMVSVEEEEAREAVDAEARAAITGQDAPPTGQANGKKTAREGSASDDGDEAATPSGAAALSAQVVSRYQFAGLSIAVENPRGSVRKWTDAGGTVTGSTLMLHDYGFIEGHIGSDGEEVDCYVGPDESAPYVHVVHQLRAPDFKVHDEDKVMLGFRDGVAAEQAYVAHRNDGRRAIGSMSIIPVDRFTAQLLRRRGTGKIRASAAEVDRAFAAIMALSNKAAALAAKPRKTTRKSEADYPNELQKRAVRLAARAMAPDLAGLRADIKGATSFDDLKKLIVDRYRNKMSSDDLARLVHRTRLMANMAGRLAVHEEAA